MLESYSAWAQYNSASCLMMPDLQIDGEIVAKYILLGQIGQGRWKVEVQYQAVYTWFNQQMIEEAW